MKLIFIFRFVAFSNFYFGIKFLDQHKEKVGKNIIFIRDNVENVIAHLTPNQTSSNIVRLAINGYPNDTIKAENNEPNWCKLLPYIYSCRGCNSDKESKNYVETFEINRILKR